MENSLDRNVETAPPNDVDAVIPVMDEVDSVDFVGLPAQDASGNTMRKRNCDSPSVLCLSSLSPNKYVTENPLTDFCFFEVPLIDLSASDGLESL